MKKYSIFILCLLLFNCSGDNNLATVTKAEKKAVSAVLDYYGGVCEKSKGFNIKNGEKINYFELVIRRSELMEQYANLLEMPASNIAYIFYKNLGIERSNYTHVRVKIILADGSSHQDEYSINILKEFEKFERVFHDTSYELRNLEYNKFISRFDTIKYPDIKSNIRQVYSKIDSLYAPSINSELTGFSFVESDATQENIKMVHVAGAIRFKDQNIPISYFIRRKDQTISGMKFEW